MKILYIDVCGGASGDMLAGGMLDLGWPLQELEKLIADMGISAEVKVSSARPMHGGIMSNRLQVDILNVYEHGHDEHGHDEHRHDEHHLHYNRNLHDIFALLSALPPAIAGLARRVFQRLAEAEAAIHGLSLEEVHFHEVGAMDSIVDIVAFCAALQWLKPDKIICSPLPLGYGWTQCAHGTIPLPAPAVLVLLEGVPVHGWPEQVETVTPTGAALLAALADEFGPMPAFTIRRSGVGGGKRISKQMPNLLRLLVGESSACLLSDMITELTCNLDDYNPEDLPLLYERLLAAGALDVAALNLLMKKNRPGLQLQVMCRPDQAHELADMILRQSSSLGVRMENKPRRILKRELFNLDTPWGEVKIKKVSPSGVSTRFHAESEDVLAICRRTGLTPWEVRQKISSLLGEIS
jgi:uncharacterized protein (TIGR00299 family) protein